jgi:hypothetical protein
MLDGAPTTAMLRHMDESLENFTVKLQIEGAGGIIVQRGSRQPETELVTDPAPKAEREPSWRRNLVNYLSSSRSSSSAQ